MKCGPSGSRRCGESLRPALASSVLLVLVVCGMLGGLAGSSLGAAAGAAPALAASGAATSVPGADDPAPPPKLELDVVATAHLDTQWRWTIRETIDEYLPATLRENLAYFEKYPDYVFSFEGAFRYMLMREYYPSEYERMRRAIADGRWRVAGSWVDAVDTNIPSPESLIRQALYGNGYFEKEFGKRSRDVFLPDCFGFGYALPSIAAHCGLLGFSTQKLTWGSAYGVPFDIGIWEGVDGSALAAALRPGDYVGRITHDWSADSSAIAAIESQGKASGLYKGLRYFGTGDQGGSPAEESVAWLEKSLAGGGPILIRPAGSDDFAREIAQLPQQRRDALPRYRGELLMTDHGIGCYTSQAAMKRWNRKNERLADAAEKASVAADWLGAAPYPRATLNDAWIRFLWHQFHDDLTGTSIPEAYVYSWNDEAIASNLFRAVLADAAGGVARALDTRAKGIPVVVFNPLSIERTDPVEAEIAFEGAAAAQQAPASVRVYAPGGAEVASQATALGGGRYRIVFLATVPAVGFAVYDVRPSDRPCEIDTGLAVAPDGGRLENERYRVAIDARGQISSIYDKGAGRELLRAPVALEMLDDEPYDWAAWEIDYDDLMAQPREIVGGQVETAVIETGPARAAVRVTRRAGGSTIRQTIRLAGGGAGTRIEVDSDVDWRTKGTLLTASFPLAVSSPNATYDLGLGAIERGVNRKELYEVPGQQWADVTEPSGAYGVAVLNDCKYGWDRPDPATLRLALIRTPRVNDRWKWIEDQESMDLGRHRFCYAIAGHSGGWQDGGVVSEADRLNQPLLAFTTTPHEGGLGATFSLVSTSDPAIAIRAVKKAEEGNEIVVRLLETTGRPREAVALSFARPIAAARELNGAEEAIGPLEAASGRLVLDFRPFQPRTIAVRLADAPVALAPPKSTPVDLPWNLVGLTPCGSAGAGAFDNEGVSLPSELLPQTFQREGIAFRTGPREPGAANVVACQGQTVPLPLEARQGDRLCIVAASVDGDREASFRIDDGPPLPLTIHDYAEPIAQWNNRVTAGGLRSDPDSIEPAYEKDVRLAWLATHRHAAGGERLAYSFGHFFRYDLPLPGGAATVTLPNDPNVRILAMSLASAPNAATRPAIADVEPPAATCVKALADRLEFLDETRVRLVTPTPGATIRYTTDGTEPTIQSVLYRGPLTIQESRTVKARAFRDGLDDHYVAALAVTKLIPRPSDGVVRQTPGLICDYYEYGPEGGWEELPNFSALEPAAASAPIGQVALPSFARAERFGLVLRGWIEIRTEGIYTFHLFSDDGSALWIGDEKAIDNDGLHGRGAVSRTLALRPGLHPIRVEYFQGLGDSALELWYEGPGVPLAPVPAELLWQARPVGGPR